MVASAEMSSIDGPAVADSIFSASGLTKVYEMGQVRVEALRGVDFDLAPGEFVVLLGPSGSGKSTLLNILGGLDVPTSGTVIYAGRNLTTAGEAALTAYRRRHIGFVFQFYNLIPSLTARENVALVTELVDAIRCARKRRSRWSASANGSITSRRSSLAASSSASRSRVPSPSGRTVLLCDEPTGALDITTGVVVLEALERVNRELGTATVVITHNAAIAGWPTAWSGWPTAASVGVETART